MDIEKSGKAEDGKGDKYRDRDLNSFHVDQGMKNDTHTARLGCTSEKASEDLSFHCW